MAKIKKAAVVVGCLAVGLYLLGRKPPTTTQVPAAIVDAPIPVSEPAAAASAPAPPIEKAPSPGIAKICLTDDDVRLGPKDQITIPATTVFEDDGPNTGKADDPSTWAYEVKDFHAALITLAPTALKQGARCAETKVQMLTDVSWTATSQSAAQNHVFAMTDVLDYPIPAKRPPVEIGKLIDDISVKAVLIVDVNQAMPSPRKFFDETAKAAQCLAGARKLAAYVGGGVGQQTNMVVSLGGVAGIGPEGATYGCSSDSKEMPNLFVDWQGRPRPPSPTLAFITKAGEYLTGATQAELRQETTACVGEALKPGGDETGNREFRGVKIECQAFARDGGGGSVTVYRRFGADPEHGETPAAATVAVDRASEAIKHADDKNAADAMKFAEWYQDPSIPEGVKTFAMMTARVVTLGEKCPTAKPHQDKIAQWAVNAGVTTEDIQSNGRYASLMAMMMSSMRAGIAKETVEEACEAAKRYD